MTFERGLMSGYGLNCEEETKFAFEIVGGKADIVHINDLIRKPEILNWYQILVFPGGFSFGDDTGSGKVFANKFKNYLKRELNEFIKRNTLTIGICNGFQIMTNLGLVPGGLMYNSGGIYIDRWVDLKVAGKSPWLTGIKKISLPIAHGEGNYKISTAEHLQIQRDKATVLRYEKGEVCKFQNLKFNPNGAQYDIAGVTSNKGRILGMMPHPERAIFFHHRPDFHMQKELLKRKNKDIPEFGDGLVIFKNAINYFQK